MHTPSQTPKPFLKRLLSRFNTTFRRKNERPAIGTSISESTQISPQLADPPAIEGQSEPSGVSLRRKVLQTATVVADKDASVGEAVPGGTIAKGALEVFCEVLKVVEVNLQNKEDVDELRSKIKELLDDLSESIIPGGDAAFEARQRRLVRKLRAKAEEIEELLEDRCARIRSQAISQAIAACFRDVETFKIDFLVMVAQHQMRRNDLLLTEMAMQTAALEVFVELQQSGPSMGLLATVKVMDPLGRPHMVPRELLNAIKDLGQYIFREWSSNPNIQRIIAPYIWEGRYDLTVNSGKTITEIATGDKPYFAEPNETIVMSVVEFRNKSYVEGCIGCGKFVSSKHKSGRYNCCGRFQVQDLGYDKSSTTSASMDMVGQVERMLANIVVKYWPGSQLVTKKRTKVLVLAVVLSLLTLYTNTNTNRYEGLVFQYNVTKPLPPGSYALCSVEGGARGVYTVDATDGVVECMLVVDEWVKGVGSLGEVEEIWKGIAASDSLPVVRVPEGAVVVPGFADSHCHILEYGFSKQIPLEGLRTLKESVEAVAHYVQSNPDILADGVSQATLDANGPYPADVDGGVIVRDAQGNVTGLFIDTAMTLIRPPVITPQMQHRRFANTVRDALRFGLTSLHDAGFNPISLDFFTRQSKRHAGLPLRIYGMSFFNVSAIDVHSFSSPPSPSSSSNGAYWGSTRRKVDGMDGETRLSVRSVKIFADGALRTMGAALSVWYWSLLMQGHVLST
ncbi:hypothetical protein FA15DRAFT_708296 [Coprinopsis marcescibilis]|uniref:Amidohydrolase 3 domain-containing protein n=1 Tax=Coprinopsis marcescibilis TaxID=230819 RepID=A0A5C3KJW9_COPMA|nr:hypothetical protein FA15DRAFT_708296 [Coprinopsis marcescibilis]